jgi:lipoprotein-anchoring transpeptidase ErfK/SrfK
MSRLLARQRRTTQASFGALVGLLALTACVSAGASDQGSVSGGPTSSAAAISIRTVGAKPWNPNRPVVVAVKSGQLTDVLVTDRQGHSVKGRLGRGGTTWHSTQSILDYNVRYSVRATAVDSAGLVAHQASSFRTVAPEHVVYSEITPSGGAVVGVGMPIIVSFGEPVPNRAAAETHLSVNTSRPTVGGWYWVSDQMVRWRPKDYWRPGTVVVVRSDLAGVSLGQGTWGNDDDQVKFTIGDAMVSTVDIANHDMVVERNGQVIRRVPVTTGKPGWDTRNGVKVIMSKDRQVVMDAATIDVNKQDPEYYRLDVEYAMRVTWSGEYLHAAPWSVSSQGQENVSHGCTGMSLENASWYYNISRVGDVVEYINGVRGMEPWNGYTDWTIPWEQWQAGSALH